MGFNSACAIGGDGDMYISGLQAEFIRLLTKMFSHSSNPGRFRSPVPLRFIIPAIIILAVVVVLWPASEKTAEEEAAVTASDKISVDNARLVPPRSDMKDVLDKTPVFSKTLVETPKTVPTAETVTQFTLQDIQNFQPAASLSAAVVGRPINKGGVYLPEPRPDIISYIHPSATELKERLSQLKENGIHPVSVKIKPGDTLAESLTSGLGIAPQDAHYAIESLKASLNPRDIRPGQTVTAYMAETANEPVLMALILQKDVLTNVTTTRISQARFAANDIVRPATRNLKAVRGEIKNSLYLAANAEDVPDRVVVELIRIYSWSIDFQRDIRANDKFEILYEEYKTDDGMLVPGKGNILYATLTLGNRTYPMYRFETNDHRVDYFEPDGRSVRKALMKTPVDGARISSGFGMRHHPVLGYSRMHKGMDFAAPSGTPIYAAGDGVIERANRFSSFGNYIKIRHRSDLKTAYAHLKGFAKGIHAGKRVRQGDVIGYIGTTGRSTGPHLHYEVHLNGKQVNPNSIDLPTGEKLKGQELAAFRAKVREMNAAFAELGLGQTVVAQKMDMDKDVN